MMLGWFSLPTASISCLNLPIRLSSLSFLRANSPDSSPLASVTSSTWPWPPPPIVLPATFQRPYCIAATPLRPLAPLGIERARSTKCTVEHFQRVADGASGAKKLALFIGKLVDILDQDGELLFEPKLLREQSGDCAPSVVSELSHNTY